MRNIVSVFYDKKLYFLFSISFLISALIYSQYFTKVDFPDEFDNFANTWLILNGLIVYKDFFSNHLPTLMILGLPAELISHSKLAYRIEIFILYFSFFYLAFRYLEKYLKISIIPFMLLCSFAIALYGGHHFADGTIWSITLLSAFFIVAKNIGKTLSKKETIIFSMLMFATIMSSPTHLFGFILLIIFHLLTQKKRRLIIKNNLENFKTLLISIAIPSLLFVIYLLSTNSLANFYKAAIEYNNNYYYYRLYPDSYFNFHLLDYYLHTSRDVLNHIYEININQVPYLLGFISSIKSMVFHPALILDSSYKNIIFSTFYENFFTFEVIILLFYLFGFVAIFKHNRSLAFFSLLFIFGLRVRINEGIHMAPYYLFSYWMIGTSISIFMQDILQQNKKLLNLILLTLTISLIFIFLQKYLFNYKQAAYNRFSYGYEKTTNLLQNVDKDQKIMAITPFMAAHYWVGNHQPAGYFINYYNFFDKSPYLKNIWDQDLRNYKGNYLIVGKDYWKNYKDGKSDWLDESLDYINSNFDIQNYPETEDYIFKRKQFPI